MKKSVKILIGVLIAAVVVVGLYFVLNALFPQPKQISMELEAVMILEDGTEYPCTVTIRGRLWEKSTKDVTAGLHTKDPETDGIYIDGAFMTGYFLFYPEEDNGWVLGCDKGLLYLNRDFSQFGAEVDAHVIRQELPRQTAHVFLKSMTEAQRQEVLTLFAR